MHEVQDALPCFVEHIVLQPSAETGELGIRLEGTLSDLFSLAFGAKRKKA